MNSAIRKARRFEREAHEILSKHEASTSRAYLLDDTYKKLSGLSLDQDQLIRQALRCVESKLFRAAHILAWTAYMDLIQNKLGLDSFKKVNTLRPTWNIKTVENFWEKTNEFQIIETCKKLKLITEQERRMLQSYLTKRNWCAHPSNFYPDYNQTLGYVTDILKNMEKIQKRSYP